VVGQGAGLPGGGWLELRLVSHSPSAEHGLVAATYSNGEHALQYLPRSKQAGVVGGGNSCFPNSMTLAGLEPAICWANGPAGHVGARAAIGARGPTEDWLRIS